MPEELSMPDVPQGSTNRDPSPAQGDTIGRYRLLQVIGEGSFGSVYLAEQESPVRRRVALKIIKLGMDTKQVIARFEAERQALAMMNHPNVARVLDAGATESGRPYFVMEYVPGIPITEHCDKHNLSINQRLHLFIQVCEAVQHAHQKGLIHRDLKPSNVLVTIAQGKAVPKVIDFGVAKATAARLTERTLFTERGLLIGTPEYMSPEQAGVDAQDIDTRSDIYSLGVLLYEMLSGTLPFDSRTLRTAGYAEIQRIIREVDPPRPSTKLSSLSSPVERGTGGEGVSVHDMPSSAIDIARHRQADLRSLVRHLRGDLDWIVMKALEKDRARRYASATEFASDIQRHLAHQPVLAGPPTVAYRMRKFIRRNRTGVIAAALVGLALIAGVGGTSLGLIEARRQRDDAVAARFAEAEQTRIALLNEQKARDEAQRADREARNAQAAQAEEKKRADELQQVSRFQSSMLEDIDVQLMGTRLREDLLAETRNVTGAAHLDDDQIKERTQQIDRLLAGVNFTNAAVRSLDRNVLQRAMEAIDKQFLDQPVVQAGLLQTLADVYFGLGLYDAAAGPQERALAIRRRVLGDEHPDTLHSINSLGELLWTQGKPVEAEVYYREALEKCRRVLGDEHRDTLASINNMGALLQSQGKLAEAEPYLRKALEKNRRVLGDEHPDTLASLNNMGALLKSQGKPAEAEPYYREALEKRRRVLGDDHPDTLQSINNMGGLLRSQRKLAEAEVYYREALEKCRRVLGDDHPDTLTSINNMGSLLQSQGKFAEAEPYFREALEKFRRVLGDDHPDTLTSINNMGGLLQMQGKLAEAEPYFREALQKRRRVLGDDHPDTLQSINNLAGLLFMQGKFTEAEPYYREALAGFERRPGPARWEAGSARLGLGRTLTGLSRFAESEEQLVEAERLLRTAQGVPPGRYKKSVEALIELNEKWHAAEPGKDHDAKAAEWRAKLAELQTAAAPAAAGASTPSKPQ